LLSSFSVSAEKVQQQPEGAQLRGRRKRGEAGRRLLPPVSGTDLTKLHFSRKLKFMKDKVTPRNNIYKFI
jgi:hypothetical protein